MAAGMVVSILAGDTLTGKIWGELPLGTGAASWSTEHRGEGKIDVTLPLQGEILDLYPDLVDTLVPWKCFLAVVAPNGTVLEAGPIRHHSYTDADANLKIAANGLRAYFARRFLMINATPGRWQSQVFQYYGMSLGTIQKRLVQATMAHIGGALPIDLPRDETGIHTRTYYGYEVPRISELLRDLEDVENGPDLRFEPYLPAGDKAGFLRWRLDTGTNTAPELTQYNRPGGAPRDFVWDRTAPETTVDALDVDIDADTLGDRAWVTGQGSEFELRIGRDDRQGLRIRGYPLLEVDDSRTTTKEQSTLDGYAAGLARRSSRPWTTWTMKVRANTNPELGPIFGTYRPGDWVRVYIGTSHPYIRDRDGYYRTRIMAISGDLSDAVKVVLAPTLEDR